MSIGNIAEGAVGGLFGRDRDLPLYKDKPYYHHHGAIRQRRKMWLRKRILVLVSGLLFGLWWFGIFSSSGVTIRIPSRAANGPVDWDVRREKVKDAFVSSWDAYEKHAWGNIPLLPSKLPEYTHTRLCVIPPFLTLEHLVF